MMRPRGNPPTPSAASSEIEPVEITEIGNDRVLRSQPHDRALAELFFDLRYRQFDRLAPLVCHESGSFKIAL